MRRTALVVAMTIAAAAAVCWLIAEPKVTRTTFGTLVYKSSEAMCFGNNYGQPSFDCVVSAMAELHTATNIPPATLVSVALERSAAKCAAAFALNLNSTKTEAACQDFSQEMDRYRRCYWALSSVYQDESKYQECVR